MIGLIMGGVTALISAVSSGWARWQERKQADQEIELAIAQAKIAQVSKQLELRNKLSIAQLRSTPPYFKVLTFCLWFAPFVITIISPETGALIFNNLGAIPAWYSKSCIVILFAVWGIAVSKETITGILSTAFDDLKYRSKAKSLEKAIRVDREAFFETLREGRGHILKEDVPPLDAAIDRVERDLNRD